MNPRLSSARLATAALLPVLLLTACSSSGSSSVKANGTVDGSSGVVTVKGGDDLKFAPNIVNAKVGVLKLTFTDSGQVPHNLAFDDASLGKTATINGGTSATLDVTFPKAGTYTFQCTIHPGMTGKVVVRG